MKTNSLFRDLFLLFGTILLFLSLLALLATSGLSLPIIIGISLALGIVLIRLLPRLLREQETREKG